jgi:hypothetical protein
MSSLFDQRTWIILASLGSLFFVGLTIYYSLQQQTRQFVPATCVIALGCVSSLIRGTCDSHSSSVEGIWRLLTILLLIGGGIMYQRESNRMKRRTDRGETEG